MINSFERSVTELQKEVPTTIYSMVVHADTGKKINDLKAFIKQ
ncbi:MAG: hypothetical protein PHS04_17645 [Tissierellia bacterium]|nr:hypothetical protein [Tissierellia bacterium]